MQQPSETSVLERPVGVLQLVDALAESKLHWDGDGFTSWASETFGISTSSVKRAMRVATSVCPDVLDALRTDRAASNDRLGLYALSRLDHTRQREALERWRTGRYRNLSAAALAATDPVTARTGGVRAAVAVAYIDRTADTRRLAALLPPTEDRAMLLLGSAHLPDGLRLSARWGFDVIDSIVLALPEAQPGGPVTGRRLHLTVLVGASGKPIAPAAPPDSVVMARRGGVPDLARQLWPLPFAHLQVASNEWKLTHV